MNSILLNTKNQNARNSKIFFDSLTIQICSTSCYMWLSFNELRHHNAFPIYEQTCVRLANAKWQVALAAKIKPFSFEHTHKKNNYRTKANVTRKKGEQNIELHIQFGAEAIQLNPWISNSAILSLPIHWIRYFAELISINLAKRYRAQNRGLLKIEYAKHFTLQQRKCSRPQTHPHTKTHTHTY